MKDNGMESNRAISLDWTAPSVGHLSGRLDGRKELPL